ncbi:efflux RND transporter periplasmic adaptor subunit [Pusillimonas sp. ANT_WB101]|uniref:efflux RND transporter periplasmic adaptor subunit n=1 Tax=Pusillimonas sp. ANT_WB101 TaxID=2597356 RepID=UPI0011EE4450|nr:efflux RND transporter periplasmic adaptor subunit [Pusillimonas sp. ANT_WB101]KAA0893079.1 efflux RND transporter periplasmic adaptor subunit [Pusillimonas sp. ANT_WB101]
MKFSIPGLILVLALGVAAGVYGSRWQAERSQKTVPAQVKSAPTAGKSTPASSKSKTVVEVEAVRQVSMPRSVSAVGSLRSRDSVILRPEITGRITEINFAEGGKVEKGQVLVRLDDSVVRAEVQQAQANLSLASSKYRRAQQLTKQGFISKQALDEASSQFKVQQAELALAKAHLSKTVIVAPFDGLIGLRTVSVGDYVSPGIDLVPIESIDPLQVDFRIPEQFLSDIKLGQKLAVSFDALPGQSRQGEVGAISPLIDVGGRSLLLRANVPNPDDILRPGIFARVRLQFADDATLVVPETAISPSGDEQFVYRVVDGKVQRVAVRLGMRRDGRVEVIDGIQPGDLIVTSGLQKVSQGQEVEIAKPPVSATAS